MRTSVASVHSHCMVWAVDNSRYIHGTVSRESVDNVVDSARDVMTSSCVVRVIAAFVQK